MLVKFNSEGKDPLSLTNDDYGKLLSFYDLTNETAADVFNILRNKYLTGELQQTVEKLSRY